MGSYIFSSSWGFLSVWHLTSVTTCLFLLKKTQIQFWYEWVCCMSQEWRNNKVPNRTRQGSPLAPEAFPYRPSVSLTLLQNGIISSFSHFNYWLTNWKLTKAQVNIFLVFSPMLIIEWMLNGVFIEDLFIYSGKQEKIVPEYKLHDLQHVKGRLELYS